MRLPVGASVIDVTKLDTCMVGCRNTHGGLATCERQKPSLIMALLSCEMMSVRDTARKKQGCPQSQGAARVGSPNSCQRKLMLCAVSCLDFAFRCAQNLAGLICAPRHCFACARLMPRTPRNPCSPHHLIDLYSSRSPPHACTHSIGPPAFSECTGWGLRGKTPVLLTGSSLLV